MQTLIGIWLMILPIISLIITGLVVLWMKGDYLGVCAIVGFIMFITGWILVLIGQS